MLIASAGCWTWGFLFDWTKARAKERLPILPQYIRRMMINRDTGCSALVIPVVIPTVPMAENVSNRISENPSGCIAIMASDAVSANSRLIVSMVPARLTASFSSLRPKILIPYVCLMLECTHKRRTTRVVVLIPPAVDPGLPPTKALLY